MGGYIRKEVSGLEDAAVSSTVDKVLDLGLRIWALGLGGLRV